MPHNDRTHKQVIVLRKDLNMRKGKMVAQGAHASMAAILNLAPQRRPNFLCRLWSGLTRRPRPDSLAIPLDNNIGPWLNGRFAKICVSVPDEASLELVYARARAAGLPCAIIRDSGLTEFHGTPTLTAVAVGPGPVEEVDDITGALPLL